MTDLLLPLSALAFPPVDPVIFAIGPVAVHWYGAAYVVGILFGWWYAKRLVANPALWREGRPAMSPADIDDFLLWAALGIVLGGRIGYILFYDFERYLANPFDILAIWRGGMSFHGGMLGTILAMVLFARSRGILPWSLLDVIAASTPPALGLVRCTNFINSELWGRVSPDTPWAFVVPPWSEQHAGEVRLPTQLYEAALEGIVLFAALWLLTHRYKKLGSPRFVGAAFIFGYGLIRTFVEFFREPDAQLGYLLGTGWLTMGMVLSLPMILAGLWGMLTARPVVFEPREALRAVGAPS